METAAQVSVEGCCEGRGGGGTGPRGGQGPPRPRQLALVGCKQEGCWLINIGEGECGVRGGRAQEGGDMPTSPPPPRCHGGQSGRGQADLAIITAQQAFV